jgi:hypothetical protein
MNVKLCISVLTVCAPFVLTGCGNKTDANEHNFSAALEQYFSTNGDLCLGETSWPIEAGRADILPFPLTRAGMTALESAGLVKSEDIEKDDPYSFIGKPRKIKVQRFTPTDAAKPYLHAGAPAAGGKASNSAKLCWGHMALDKVVKWEGTEMKLVSYTYKTEHLADWANRPDIQAAFPQIKNTTAESNKGVHGLVLTSEGWEVRL